MSAWFLYVIAAQYAVAAAHAATERRWVWALALLSWSAGNYACGLLARHP